MAAYSGEVFAERAYLAGVPAQVVAHKCRNWGLRPQRSADLADEAAAEAYSRSLTRCFENEDHYRAWVTQTALNYTVDKLRRESRSQSLTWIVPEVVGASNPHSVAVGLAEGLATLAEDERNLLTLTYEEDLTLDQIARRIAIGGDGSPNAKRLRIKRKRDDAQRKLRKYLIDNGYWHERQRPNMVD
jgi:DNA-directed RNA polymerase specialized sigma24 family protein